jgi:MFS family permease
VQISSGVLEVLVPAFALLPLFVREELGGDVGMQAWVTSAFGAGVIAGGLALGVWGGSTRRVRAALASILGLGAATLALGVTPASLVPVAVVAMLAVGAFSAIANGCIAAVLQATIAPEYQGRVFTLMMSVASAMTPIGLLLATPVADAAGSGPGMWPAVSSAPPWGPPLSGSGRSCRWKETARRCARRRPRWSWTTEARRRRVASPRRPRGNPLKVGSLRLATGQQAKARALEATSGATCRR